MSSLDQAFDSPQQRFQSDLREELDRIFALLAEKNRKYGDSALNPKQTFSRAHPLELINIRIDDKLNRIQNRQNDEDEDVDLDLIGYLLIRRIAQKRLKCK